jgi:hypothetical protein
MTAGRRDGNDTPFADWLRSEPRLDSITERLSVTDCDYWIHQYRAHHDRIGERLIDSILLLELKVNNTDLPYSQRDTLRLVNEGFRQCFYTKSHDVKTMTMKFGSEVRKVRCYGAFLLVLSKARPDEDGCLIKWHGRLIDRDQLIEILTFQRDPRTLHLRAERRHHAPNLMQAQQIELLPSRVANLPKRN